MLQANTKEQLAKVAEILHIDIDTWDIAEYPVYEMLTMEMIISFDQMAEIVDYLRMCNTKKEKADELFEECWVTYKRKGSKKKSREYWNKLSQREKEQVLPHIKAYAQSREIQYQKDFERYLRDKTFKTIVFLNNAVLYDPTRQSIKEYMPQGRGIYYDENTKSYMCIEPFYGEIYDGYTNDNRPDGARISLNNGRGTITWSANTHRWN